MTKWVVILGFIVSFGAGLAVGTQRHALRPGGPGGERGGGDRGRDRSGWLASELSLTREQQAAMDKIWSQTASLGRREQDERRRQFRREREDDIAALVRPEDLGKYDEIQDRYGKQVSALDREVRDQFRAAVEQTKQLLTPEQRAKYDEILKRHQWDRDGGGRDGGGRDGNRGGGRDGGRGGGDRGNRDDDNDRHKDRGRDKANQSSDDNDNAKPRGADASATTRTAPN